MPHRTASDDHHRVICAPLQVVNPCRTNTNTKTAVKSLRKKWWNPEEAWSYFFLVLSKVRVLHFSLIKKKTVDTQNSGGSLTRILSFISTLWAKYLTSTRAHTEQPFMYKHAVRANSGEANSRHRFISSVQGKSITVLPTRRLSLQSNASSNANINMQVISLAHHLLISGLCFNSSWMVRKAPNKLFILNANKIFGRKIRVCKFQLGFRQISNILENQAALWLCW